MKVACTVWVRGKKKRLYQIFTYSHYLAYNHGDEILKDMFLVNADNPAIRQDIIKQIYEHGSVESFKESDYASLKSGASVAFDVYSTVAGLEFK